MRRRSVTLTLPPAGRLRQRWELPNGIRIIAEHIPSAYSVALGVWVLAGSRDEDPSFNGLAHLLEHLVAGYSQRHTSRQLAFAFERLGTEVNAYTTKEAVCYSAQTLRPHVPQVMKLIATQLMHPRLTKHLLERERRVIAEEILTYADDPEEVLYEQAETLLLGNHPLGMPIAGTPESLQRIALEDVATFHSRFYVGERILVTIAGDVVPEEAATAVAYAFGNIPQLREPLPPRFPPAPQPAQERTLQRPLHQAHILFARLLPKMSPNERSAVTLLNFLLGEGWGSRLYQRIRERSGLVYTIASELEWFSDCGIWSISA
ncbi:MAG: insulinase family protein, partial [Candidatus Kapabacteria bacterium]|nr:insulinase family protein [Candidatus Kapabacteria bacterium]